VTAGITSRVTAAFRANSLMTCPEQNGGLVSPSSVFRDDEQSLQRETSWWRVTEGRRVAHSCASGF